MRRRTFLKASGATVLATAMQTRAGASRKPNILIVMTDQQFGGAMSCAMGREHIHTPHMDSLAENGVRFTRAYSPNPLCVPMRTSMMTGRYPHETGIQMNTTRGLDPAKHVFLGKILKDAGYETAYSGKWHVPISRKKTKVHGFDAAGRIPEFLAKAHDRPFLAVASFLGPHEICQWARRQKVPGGPIGDPPPPDERPPLMANFDPPENETDIMAHMRRSYQAHRLFPVGDYTKDDWRRLIWGYYRLIERVDGAIGKVLGALRDSGQEENTVVVFLSDHGDCHGAHRWNQKTVFYDESVRVPFIISWKGKTPKGTSSVLANVGVDLIPTLCDFAGVEVPAGLPGKSLKAPALGKAPEWKREYVVSQNHMVQCSPVDGKHLKPQGRMVRSRRYKYCLYSEGTRRESLVDMEKDPGEMVNLAGDPKSDDVLKQHRAFLKEHAEHHKDKMALEMLRHVEGLG